jgi:hypothetical protein
MSRFTNLQSLENHLHERFRVRSKLCLKAQKQLYRIVLLTQISSPSIDSGVLLCRATYHAQGRTSLARCVKSQKMILGRLPLQSSLHPSLHLSSISSTMSFQNPAASPLIIPVENGGLGGALPQSDSTLTVLSYNVLLPNSEDGTHGLDHLLLVGLF